MFRSNGRVKVRMMSAVWSTGPGVAVDRSNGQKCEMAIKETQEWEHALGFLSQVEMFTMLSF